jgi:hydroxymethylglutaryl-CoA lyase
MKIIECPRDAIQGIKDFIPTDAKARYINQLLTAGFDTIDFGSFVSSKAIPQMSDTAEVLKKLSLNPASAKLLVIVVNEQGAKAACCLDEITYLGFPFSLSETFQQQNTGATIEESVERVKAIQKLCLSHGKELIIYFSMGFGNPYGEPWHAGVVMKYVNKLRRLGIRTFTLADTVGIARPATITYLLGQLAPVYPDLEFGIHLHTTAESSTEKVRTAFEAGCRRFDTAILGYGGCPMTGDELVGNLATECLTSFFAAKDISTPVSAKTIEKLEIAFQQLIIN